MGIGALSPHGGCSVGQWDHNKGGPQPPQPMMRMLSGTWGPQHPWVMPPSPLACSLGVRMGAALLCTRERGTHRCCLPRASVSPSPLPGPTVCKQRGGAAGCCHGAAMVPTPSTEGGGIHRPKHPKEGETPSKPQLVQAGAGPPSPTSPSPVLYGFGQAKKTPFLAFSHPMICRHRAAGPGPVALAKFPVDCADGKSLGMGNAPRAVQDPIKPA